MISPKEFCNYIVGIEWREWYQPVFDAVLNPDIRVILINLIRQSGKSTLLFSIVLYFLFNVERWQGAGISSSKDTNKSVFRQKVSDIVQRSPKLRADAKILNESCSVPRLMSHFELFPSENIGGLVGRSVDGLFFDEACLIPDESIASAIPSTLGKPDPKLFFGSSSWSPSGNFYEMIMAQEKNPSPDTYLLRTNAQDLNPQASRRNLDHMSKMLTRINKAYEQRFLDIQFSQIEDEFLSADLIENAIEKTLGNLTRSQKRCYAFLDLSSKRDLTSRVIVEVDGDVFRCINIAAFNPQDFKHKRIDYDVIKALIVDDYLNFRIQKYLIDERHESGELLLWSKKRGYPLTPFSATVKSNMEIWGRLCELLNDGKIKIPQHQRLTNELRNLRIEEFSFGRSFRIVDAQKKYHRDISMSLAGACWIASESRKKIAGTWGRSSRL